MLYSFLVRKKKVFSLQKINMRSSTITSLSLMRLMPVGFGDERFRSDFRPKSFHLGHKFGEFVFTRNFTKHGGKKRKKK